MSRAIQLQGRFLRRAALRGGLAAGLTWVVSRRGVDRITAATAAFAVGAAQEVPVAAAPLAGAATAVALSARRRRNRSAVEIGVGAGMGSTIAFATRRWWPVAPHEPAEIRRQLKSMHTEPSPQGGGLTIVVNPSAGSGNALSENPADELRKELPEAEIVELEEGDDLIEALEKAAGSARALGMAGGDGSINAAAGVARGADKPLVVVPAGTLNHLARDLGLTSTADAIEAVRNGSTVAVDMGEIDGRPFLNTASFGNYVDLVDAREKLEHRIGKWPAVVVALARVLRHSEPVHVEIDGEYRRIWMIFIGNCRYHPAGFAPSWRERLDDGELDVRTVDAASPFSRTRLLLAVLTGTLARCGVYEHRVVKELQVRSRQGPIRLARDGETFDGSEEFSVAKCADPLLVYRP